MYEALGGAAAGGMTGQLLEALGLNTGREAVTRLVGSALTDQDNITSGSQLLEAMGVTPGGLGSTLGGFAADVALDPLTYAGMIGGGAASAMRGAGQTGSMLADMEKLSGAARAAEYTNAGRGAGLLNESVARMGVSPLSVGDDVAALGPRVGAYGRDMSRIRSAPEFPNFPRGNGTVEAGNTISPNVVDASQIKGASRKATADARSMAREQAFAANRDANVTTVGGARDALAPTAGGDYLSGGGEYMNPGLMLDPNSPLRGSVLAGMDPAEAQEILGPLLQALQQNAGPRGMSGLDYAALAGTGAGAIGGGVYAGSR